MLFNPLSQPNNNLPIPSVILYSLILCSLLLAGCGQKGPLIADYGYQNTEQPASEAPAECSNCAQQAEPAEPASQQQQPQQPIREQQPEPTMPMSSDPADS